MIPTTAKAPTFEFMRAGYLTPWVAEFGVHLKSVAHTELTVRNYTDAARHFSWWICARGLGVEDLVERTVAEFAQHRCRCPGGRQWKGVSAKYARKVLRFWTFLAGKGVVPAAEVVACKKTPRLLIDYERWLSVHRGLSDRSVARHGRTIERALAVLGEDAQQYSVTSIRAVVQAEATRCGPSQVKVLTSALRCYLRYLASLGLCQTGLDNVVPTVPQWRLSTLPRYLPSGDVERLIATCRADNALDRRDRAVLLLLARLGMRAGDVFSLSLDDFDWSAGTVRVCGKTRRSVRLPLPQEVGDAVLAYIERGRPRVANDRVFLKARAPFRSFGTSSSISYVVKRALRRAGVKDPPSRGASLLRHSAATTLLRAGGTLEAVGALLRHRSLDMTAHYAKVDVKMLAAVAQPWPGDA